MIFPHYDVVELSLDELREFKGKIIQVINTIEFGCGMRYVCLVEVLL